MSRLKKRNDVGSSTPKDNAGDSGAGTGREMGRACGGITLVGGTWEAREDVRDADEVLLEVLERGGAFPTYPHCTEADQLIA